MTGPNHLSKRHFVYSLVLVVLVARPSWSCTGWKPVSHAQDRTAWMKEARWGVMNHYLADWIIARREKMTMNVERWNELIDSFDVEGLANQIESVGAGYYLITIGQNSGYYLAPNAPSARIPVQSLLHNDISTDFYNFCIL